MSKLLTIAELSKITGLGVTTIRRRVSAGTLPYTRANANSGKLLFNEELVQTVLRNEAYSPDLRTVKFNILKNITKDIFFSIIRIYRI